MKLCGNPSTPRNLFGVLLILGCVPILVYLVPKSLRLVGGDNVNGHPFVTNQHHVTDHPRSLGHSSFIVRLTDSGQNSSENLQHNTITNNFIQERTHYSTIQKKISAFNKVSVFKFPTAPKHSPSETNLYLTIPVTGMLGNRMFQYASILGIAHMNDRTPFYHSSSRLQNIFNVTHIQDRSHSGFQLVNEINFAMFDPKFQQLPRQNVVVMQYLQSWKYFDAIRDTIKHEFGFKQQIKDSAEKLLQKFASQITGKVKVGVHVRRGDFLTMSSQQKGYHAAPGSYLIKAMDYMRKKYKDVIFIFVTTDRVWCEMALKAVSDYIILDMTTAEIHMAALTLCDHVIMTVGTFGWWGGYLGGGEVVYYWDPKQCLHSPPLPVEIREPGDFFPPHWTPLTG